MSFNRKQIASCKGKIREELHSSWQRYTPSEIVQSLNKTNDPYIGALLSEALLDMVYTNEIVLDEEGEISFKTLDNASAL